MSEQDRVIATLERKGFHWVNKLSYGAVVMQKRNGALGWTQAEVDEDGSVNGVSVEEYLKGMTAKNITAGGWGRFSEDLSDILEGLVRVNKKTNERMIFQIIKRQLIHDRPLAEMVSEEGMTDEDLQDLIRENMRAISLFGSEEQKVAKSRVGGGWGRFSEDLADVLQAQLMINKRRSDREIFQIIKRDRGIVKMMREEGMTDGDLLEFINDTYSQFIMDRIEPVRGSDSMDRNMVSREILKVAKELMALEIVS
jgi:hypothetical protein